MVVDNVVGLTKAAKAFGVPTVQTTVLEERGGLLIRGPEICVAMPAIQAAGEGYEVHAVTDASGGVSAEAHERAVRRMTQAGITPITWQAGRARRVAARLGP